ncbi:hypothetical protein Tco_0074123 [Tanacetum coccineum]
MVMVVVDIGSQGGKMEELDGFVFYEICMRGNDDYVCEGLRKKVRLTSTPFFAKVANLESSLSQRVADNIDDSVPIMVADALEDRLPELLYDTIKNILTDLLKDTVKKALPKFDNRVKKTLRAEVPKILLKPLNREFNALNRMESRWFVLLQNQLSKAIRTTIGKSLQTKIEKNASDILELVELIRELVRLIDPVPASANAAIEEEYVSTQAQYDHVMDNEQTAKAQGEQTSTHGEQASEQVPPTLTVFIFKSPSEEPLVKKLKFVLEDFTIPSPTPLNSIKPPVTINNIPFEQF